MSLKITIKAKDVDNYDLHRMLTSWLEVYADETGAVIDVDSEEVPEGYEFDHAVWEGEDK